MISKGYNELVRQLKRVPKSQQWKNSLDIETRERMRARVMAYVMEHGGQPARKLSLGERLKVNINFLRYITPPSFAYGMAAFVVFVASAGAAIAARNALPGQSLYSAKIALEQTHVRFVSNPSERAKVQMEFAGRRLEEARSASPEQESKTLKRFSKEVKQAKNTLKEAADPLQVEAATAELSKKAREYQEELLKSKNTKSERSVDVAAYEEATNALKEVTGEKTAE